MTGDRKTLDELTAEADRERIAQIDADDKDPATIARREARKREEFEKDVRLGLRDADGNWIEQTEEDDLDEDEEGDGDDDFE